jgi:Ca-activated chloride channel family protein
MANCLPHLLSVWNRHHNNQMKTHVHETFVATLALLGLFVTASAVAAQEKPDRPPWAQPSSGQDQQTPPPAGASKEKSPATGSPRGTVKVTVNLVNVLVSVVDDHNRPAPNLPLEAFQVFEEGVQQNVAVFESETKQPLDLALMIDASLSEHTEMAGERDAACHFIQQILRPDDRLSVFGFDETVTQMAPFSSEVATLQAAVRKIPDGAGTSIYDAVLLGSKALEKRSGERRRVIIMVTDAGETTSRADFESARKSALRAGILLYTIVMRPVKNENGRNTAGEHALQTITETTGGAMFFPDSPQELPIIFDRIDNELRTQYRLAYYPNPRGPANTYRTIEVKVLPGYSARHRTTYLTEPY